MSSICIYNVFVRLIQSPKLFLVVALCVFSLGCKSIENHFIYNPSVYPVDWNQITDDRIEEVRFFAADGTELHGLYAQHANPRATILFAHGRKGNVTTTLDNLSKFINHHKVSVFVFDYRGFGRSDGKPDEAGIYMDARAARKWLAGRTGLSEDDVILMGHSLGAAVAIELAATDGAKGLIVESGFTSLPDFVRHHAPPIPARTFLISEFNSLEKMANYNGPLLICHGSNDQIIPFSHGQRLFEAAKGPKHFVKIADGEHSTAPTSEYQIAIDQFVDDIINR